MLESVGQRSPKDGQDVDDEESLAEPMSRTFQEPPLCKAGMLRHPDNTSKRTKSEEVKFGHPDDLPASLLPMFYKFHVFIH